MEIALVREYASKIITAYKNREQIPVVSGSIPELGIEGAYEIAQEIKRRRLLRGENPVGIKIGFTNRNIWERYNATGPIVGEMYDTTVLPIEKAYPIQRFLEPKIEPEVIFCLRNIPNSSMSDYELINCIDSIAHGFEIVHSVYRNWNFKTVDTIAAFGLHGVLLHGPFQKVFRKSSASWLRMLSGFNLELFLNGNLVDQGKAANILDIGPLQALKYILKSNNRSINQSIDLRPGDLIATGTLTAAHSIGANQKWSTKLSGISLKGISLEFS